MKLYGLTPSPFYRKCIVLMEEKGLEYETERLIPMPKTAKLLSMHPMGKIPILQDGEHFIADGQTALRRGHQAADRSHQLSKLNE